jgi:ABC-type multidrug transport system permease subunit
VFAVSATTVALQTALGFAGTGLAMLVFIILGNSSAGGPYQLTFAPGFWRTLGPYLPQTAAVSALRGAVYFDGTNIGVRLAVLALYAAGGSVVCIALGRRRGPRADELELAGAAAA